MSSVTLIWSILIGGCITAALPQFVIWIWQQRAVHLLFVILTAAVVANLSTELVLMRAGSLEQFATALRWRQVPLFVDWVAIVLFVRFYFGTGQWWLGITACGVRLACLVINFALPPNLYFREMTALEPVRLLGETVWLPIGVVAPWSHLAELSSVPLVAFVLDASIGLWRQGKPWARRRALIIGGSITFYEVLAGSVGMLIHQTNIPALIYVVSLPFVAVVFAMAFELSFDLFRAGQVALKLQTSESSLLESEERFLTMANAAPVMIWMAAPDKLCTFFNKAWLEFTGRTIEQERGNGWSDGVHPDDFDACLKTYVKAFDARESFTMQYRLRRHDGEYRSITDRGVPRFGPRGNFRGYVGACVDITDLLEQQKALHEFEERVALAAEAAHLGVWELDTKTNQLWMSDKARELFQFQPEDHITYKKFQDRIHPEDRALRDSAVQEAIRTHGGYEIEYRTPLPDGTVRWIGARARYVADEDGALTRLLGVSMEITERKEAQELFQLATEASPSGNVLVNDQGRIILVNARIEKLFGYEREELIGKPIEVLVPERFATEHVARRAEFLGAPKVRPADVAGEVSARRKDGTEFPVEVGLNPIRTPHGTLVLATVVDISARKLAEEEARRQRTQISLLTRVSLLGEMTASLAHELNQPLSAIMSNANAGMRFMDKGKADPVTLREILADVADDALRANEIIRNVRNTIKKGGAVRQGISLNEMVKNVAHMVQGDAAVHSCELKTSLASDLPAIEGDPTQIQQVLINLLANAFEATRNKPVNKRKVELTTEKNGDETIRVTVRDYGAGISDEARGRLFEQFFTTKEEGLGMGLAIVRSIIEAHGGTIDAENVADGGARFYFTLPAAKKISK